MGNHKKHKEKHRKRRKDRSRSRSEERYHYNEEDSERPTTRPKRQKNDMEDPGSDPNAHEKAPLKKEDYVASMKSKVDSSEGKFVSVETESHKEIMENKPASKSNRPADKIHETTQSHGKEHASLSIEETNKLRARLGLKPLKQEQSTTGSEEKCYEDRADVHVPPVNIAIAKKSIQLKEKMQVIKEERRINKKLKKTNLLGVDGNDEHPGGSIISASAWISKTRNQEHEKQLAEKRAKLLEEMDEQFGVSGVVNKEMVFLQKLDRTSQKKYSSRDLAGLKIEHSGKDFITGSSVVVTLRDQGVLDEGEDVLENINMVDDRKASRNIDVRKKKSDYRPFEEIDEETGMVKAKVILEKYDEEIKGRQESCIRIDHTGRADINDEMEIDMIRSNLRAQQITLEMAAPALAKDYWTKDEMVHFKKPVRRKKKMRTRDTVKAEDLVSLVGDHQDHGSRNKSSGILKNSATNSQRLEDPVMHRKLDMDKVKEEREFLQRMKDLENLPVEDDEAELELQFALERSRKAKIRKEIGIDQFGPTKITTQTTGSSECNTKKREKKIKGTIVLDSTSEFCRTLGENIGISQETATIEDFSIQKDDDRRMENTGGWEQVVEAEKRDTKETQKYVAVLEEEPDLKVGVAAALHVACIKGFVETEKKKVQPVPTLNLPQAKAFIDEEKMRDEERDRYHRGYDRDRFDPYAFKEKDSYKPEIKLEYVDEHGRPLNEKEAFRHLSHKFHGKGSGKMKTEKRAKKMLEEMKLKNMSTIDTPLNTAQMMAERQNLSQTPYVVLSGGGKNLLTTNIISKK